MANQAENVSVYRYFLYDVLSNTFLAEVPFKNVSYGRSIKEAGPFSGSIPVIDATSSLDLYNTTLPGKTALYVLRDNECVWGGIIWSRTYDIISRNLQVNASEFPSYLHHRVVWATWSHDHDVDVTISDGVGTVTLSKSSYDFEADMPVFVAFGNENMYKYNNFFTILGSPTPTSTSFSFEAKDIDGSTIENFKDTATVTVRADTYNYVRELLDQIKVDFKDTAFSNSEIEPGANYYARIKTVARSSNIATATVPNTGLLIPGQKIKVRNVSSSYDGYQTVSEVLNETTFTFANTGSNQAVTTMTGNAVNITHKAVDKTGVVTLTTSEPHGFSPNDIVTIDGVDYFLDGEYLIDGVTTNEIIYTTYSSYVEKTKANGTAAVFPTIVVGTYGSYSNNSDLGISYSTNQLSGYNTTNTSYRGFQLNILGELLDNYSNIVNGFEYRIDCAYDAGTNSFTRTLVLLPFKPPTLVDYYESLPGGEMYYDLYPISPNPSVGGEIDLVNRPQFVNPGGSISTLGAFSTKPVDENYWVVLPTVAWNGSTPAKITESAAITQYGVDGEHLGKFISEALAEQYIVALEALQTRYLAGERYNDPVPVAALGADKIVFEHPGNIIDANMEESAEDAATRFWVVGNDSALSSDASQPYAAAAATSYLGNMDYPWPILDQKEQQSEVYEEAKLQAYAEQYLSESLPPISTFSITVNGSITPEISSYKPGDWCSIILDDPFVKLRLTSGLEPRTTVLVRKIDSFEVSIPDTPTFPEKVTLQLITEAQVDKIGTTSTS